MLDEVPALGRLDFFESALAFMAGYDLKAFLIAQSLNQIEKSHGPNRPILDNCHVWVNFATNDEQTAKRVSDPLGTATELKAMKNYAGHRLSPWLGHLTVSRSETSRALMACGEVMQLPPTDEIVMVAGAPPIRARKARYYKDPRLMDRVLPPPVPNCATSVPGSDTWSCLAPIGPNDDPAAGNAADHAANVNGGVRSEPDPPEHEEVAIKEDTPQPRERFAMIDDDPEDAARQSKVLRQQSQTVAQQVALSADNGIDM